MRYNTGLAFGGNEVRQLEFHLGAAQARDADTVLVTGTAHPPGYGRLNDAVREAMAMAARHEGLLLDPVYTGKAMAGLLAHVRLGADRSGKPGAVHPHQRSPRSRPGAGRG